MTIKWKTPAGRLRTLIERVIISQENSNEIILEAESPNGPITYSLISGQLPRGLRIDSVTEIQGIITKGFIKGSATEVRKFTESRFVIRADDGVDIEDRTFSIAVDGSDEPQWITQEGFLKVGKGKSYYVLDNSYVSIQLEAEDADINAGETLEFFLMPRGGELPPGLSLSPDGVISGFTDPIFSLEYQFQDTGAFDVGSYDTSPLDYGRNNSVGFDGYFYDTQTYDYNETALVPRRLSRVYTFAIGVSDGIYTIPRIFKIYVVTEEFLRADNTLIQVDTNVFTADSNQYRIPIWITESDLGRITANNYVTIYLDVYDPPTLDGTITYFLLDKNPDESDSVIPPGLVLDSITGELAGKVPYQDRVTKRYTFTMLAVDFPITLANTEYTLEGDWNNAIIYNVNQAVRFDGLIYVCIKQNRNVIPTNSEFWELGVSTAEKTFTVEIIGEIESGIEWISGNNLGIVIPNRPSMIQIEAENKLQGGRTVYEIIEGSLPPGLEFISTGLITGKVRQYGNNVTHYGFWNPERNYLKNDIVIYQSSYYLCQQNHISGENFNIRWWTNYNIEDETVGITSFSDIIDGVRSFTDFDSSKTTFDQTYHFKILARDTARASENVKDFYITVDPENAKVYANLYIKALPSPDQRLSWFDFISNSTVFDPKDLYRYGDPNFGIQSEIKMLVFAGIESTEAVKYVQAMSRNHYRKRLLFGNVKTAKAKDVNTQKTIYEIVYIDVIDEYEKNGKSINNEIKLSDNLNSNVLVSYDNIRVDSDIYFISDRDHQRVFPNSIKNMRSRIRTAGERNREFLPLWMRSIQDTAQYELGYTKALVLCYANPGRSQYIVSRIKSNNFDFKLIDFYTDRYIIDAVDGELKDQYLAFPQRDIMNKLDNPKMTDTIQSFANSFDSESSSFDSELSTFDQG